MLLLLLLCIFFAVHFTSPAHQEGIVQEDVGGRGGRCCA
jgi:hypothetical protein